MRVKRNVVLGVGSALITIAIVAFSLPHHSHDNGHGGAPFVPQKQSAVSMASLRSEQLSSVASRTNDGKRNGGRDGVTNADPGDGVTQGLRPRTCLQSMSAWREACGKSSTDPIVFGLMISGKDDAHLPLARIAVDSFVQQTHPAKVLLIINDGQSSVLSDSPHKGNGCVCEHRVPRLANQNLGALRNIAMGLVPSSGIWVQWDDDDWRNKTCVEGQLKAMREQQAGIVFLRRQIHLDMLWNSSMMYEYGDWGLWGTMMANTSFPVVRAMQLPNLVRGEDNFYDDLRSQTKTFVWPNPHHMYFRVIHGHNTWDREHFKPDLRFARNQWCRRMEDACTSVVLHDTTLMFDVYRKALGDSTKNA